MSTVIADAMASAITNYIMARPTAVWLLGIQRPDADVFDVKGLTVSLDSMREERDRCADCTLYLSDHCDSVGSRICRK